MASWYWSATGQTQKKMNPVLLLVARTIHVKNKKNQRRKRTRRCICRCWIETETCENTRKCMYVKLNELNITLLWISLYFILVLQPTKGAWICTGVFRESYECVVPVPVTHTPGWGIIVQLSTVACVSACYFFVHWLLHNFSQLYNHGICTLHWSIFSFSFCLQQLKRSTKHQDQW